ncbi:MAG: hypothetical protein E2O68_09765 [Deltaproteobacteria bacterium]|nr:MAG: hypothetical protein E2O68_09765 [Deltaproteobacteria bacterium]
MIFFFLWGLCYFAIFKFSPFSSLKKGQLLFLKIFDIEEELYCGQIPGIYALEEYKFFGTIFHELLEYSRVFGLPPNSFIPRLRVYLGRDLRFEKEVEKIFWEGMAQFLLIFIISWAFKFYAATIIPSSTNYWALILQISGPISFVLAFFFLRKQILLPFSPYFGAYYKLWALLKVGCSTGEILGKSKVLELRPKASALKQIHRKIKRPLKSWEQQGTPIAPLIELVMEELWEVYDQEFQRFHKMLKIISFLILAFFYLGAYFMLVWGSLAPFLIDLEG